MPMAVERKDHLMLEARIKPEGPEEEDTICQIMLSLLLLKDILSAVAFTRDAFLSQPALKGRQTPRRFPSASHDL